MSTPSYQWDGEAPERPRGCLRGCVGALIVAVVLFLGAYIGVCRYYQYKVDARLRQLKAAGLPVRGTDLQSPPIPESENAAPLYLKAADMVEPRGDGAITPPDVYTAKPPLTQAQLEELAEFVGRFGEAAALVREATARPKCRFDTDWSDGVAVLFPHMSRMRAVARFTGAEARVESHQGDQTGAVDRLRMGFVVSRHVSAEEGLIALLVGCATDAIMFRAADYVLAQGPVPPEQARALTEELRRVDYGEWMSRAMRAERVSGISVFEHLRAGHFIATGWGPSGTPALDWVYGRAFPVWRCLDELYYLDRMDEMDRRAALTPTERAAQPTPGAPIPHWALGSAIVLPTFTGAFTKADTTAARRALLATALGLEVYRQQHHAYPKQLADLRAINWPMAPDVFSDGDLVYRRTDTGFLLYSIGPDLTDDAGKPPSDIAKLREETNVDIVWTATGR